MDKDLDTRWLRQAERDARLPKHAVAERFPLAEAARAHELLETGDHVGKVVLVTAAYDRLRGRAASSTDRRD